MPSKSKCLRADKFDGEAICKMRTVLSYTYVSQQTKPASRVQSLNKYAKLLAFVVKSPPIANSNYTSV